MPLGNGGPRGLPSMPLGVLSDPRSYWTKHPSETGATYQPIAGVGTNPKQPSRLSPYASTILSTPGLSHYWRFGSINTWGTGTPYPSGNLFLNSAGPSTLGISGTVSVVPGLLPGDTDGAAKLLASGSGNLKVGDYLIADPQGNECFTHEVWVKLNSIPPSGGSSLGGAWNGTTGWMVFIQPLTGEVKLYCGSVNWATGITLTVGKVYHLAMVFGGPVDFKSYLYLNGVQVASLAANTTFATAAIIQTASAYEVGKYNSTSAGSDFLDAVIDELAIYNRMLQPAEVLQHYQTAFARQ